MAAQSIAMEDWSDFKRDKTEALELDPEETVLLTIDLQRHYLDPSVGHNLVRRDWAAKILASCKVLFAHARAAGVPVVHSYVTRRMEELAAGLYGSPFTRSGDPEAVAGAPGHAARQRMVGSPQAEVPRELVNDDDLHIADKKTMDSTLGTGLLTVLQRVYSPRYVLLAGVNTETCVYNTALSLVNHNFGVVVVTDCVGSARGEDNHVMALELMSRAFAWTLDSEEVVRRLVPAGAS